MVKKRNSLSLRKLKILIMSKTSDDIMVQNGTTVNEKGISVEVMNGGPYSVHGDPKLVQQFIETDDNGTSVAYREGRAFEAKEGTHLCRCGLSKNKPYCDGSHRHAVESGISLEETASRHPSLSQAEEYPGPVVSITDDESLCAFARFCDQDKRIWHEVESRDPEDVKLTVKMAQQCPGGRLITWNNKANTPIETQHEPVISIIEDPHQHCSGPLAFNGGIPVTSSDGFTYEVRNRQALCRCGHSSNVPFCDGSHASVRFQDNLTD